MVETAKMLANASQRSASRTFAKRYALPPLHPHQLPLLEPPQEAQPPSPALRRQRIQLLPQMLVPELPLLPLRLHQARLHQVRLPVEPPVILIFSSGTESLTTSMESATWCCSRILVSTTDKASISTLGRRSSAGGVTLNRLQSGLAMTLSKPRAEPHSRSASTGSMESKVTTSRPAATSTSQLVALAVASVPRMIM